MGVTGGLDCRPLPQRMLLISCPAALPGRGWRRVTAVFSAACLPEFQPEAPQQPGREGECLMRAVPSLSPTPFKKSSGLGLSGLCSVGACWYWAPESDACSFLEPKDTRTQCSGQEGVREQKWGCTAKEWREDRDCGERRFLPPWLLSRGYRNLS